jgi:transglutaminase-like putative cysteine protease
LTEPDDALRGFAAQNCHQRRDRSALIDLMHALNQVMVYTPGATEVDTCAAQAFAGRAGVCQDHTHAFLACARSLGIPARYVSGYLYTEDSTHLASHAWLDYLDACPVRGMRRGGGHEQMHAKVSVAPTPVVSVQQQ